MFTLRRSDISLSCSAALFCCCMENLSIADSIMDHAWCLTPHDRGRVYSGRVRGVDLEIRFVSSETGPDNGDVRYALSMSLWGMQTTEDLTVWYQTNGPDKIRLNLEAEIQPPFLFRFIPWVFRWKIEAALDHAIEQAQEQLEKVAQLPDGAKSLLEQQDVVYLEKYESGVCWTRPGESVEIAPEWVRVQVRPIGHECSHVVSTSSLKDDRLSFAESLPVGSIRDQLLSTKESLFKTANMYATAVRSGFHTPDKSSQVDTSPGHDFLRLAAEIGNELWKHYVAGPGRVQGRIIALKAHSSPCKRLLINAEDEDAQLPWELLHDYDGFLWRKVSIARVGAMLDQSVEKIKPLRPTGVLVVAADPRGGKKSTIHTEADAIVKELEAFALSKERILIDKLTGEDANKKSIEEHIETGQYNVLHFCGHSEYVEDSPDTSFLEVHDDEDPREPRMLRAEEIKSWSDTHGLQLVFLNSCSSANSSRCNMPFGGIAHAFAYLGIPYVIGTTCEISHDAAIILGVTFYRELIELSDPFRALDAARAAVSSEYDGTDPAWGSTVMYVA